MQQAPDFITFHCIKTALCILNFERFIMQTCTRAVAYNVYVYHSEHSCLIAFESLRPFVNEWMGQNLKDRWRLIKCYKLYAGLLWIVQDCTVNGTAPANSDHFDYSHNANIHCQYTMTIIYPYRENL